MITFEIFQLDIITDAINWNDKTISIRDNIKYIMVNIKHFRKSDKKENLESLESLDLPFSNNDISRIWYNNISKYSQIFNINLNKLVLGTDYYIAHLHISRSPIKKDANNANNVNNVNNVNNANNVVIGIFILPNVEIEQNQNQNQYQYRFISTIRPLTNADQEDHTEQLSDKYKNKFNILSGILNYKNVKHESNESNKYLVLDTNFKILWKHVLINARNYLPKLDIIIHKPYNFSAFNK